MDTSTSDTQKKGDRAISQYDYIRCGETSEKVGCSITSAWVGERVAYDERGYGEVWRVQGENGWAQDQFFLGDWFSCDKQKDRHSLL